MRREAFFLPAADGGRFCLYSPAVGERELGVLLYLHPFAEELNNSRRTVALQVAALSEAGYSVLQIDLFGCGDSAGDFGDATWSVWLDDVLQAVSWIKAHSSAPLWLWGLRAGCLLAADAARCLNESVNFLFWQPVSGGAQILRQFLRLAVAGDALSGGGGGVMTRLQAEIEQGKSLEIGGYLLSAALANGMKQVELVPPASTGERLLWLEVSGQQLAQLNPRSRQVLNAWQNAGFNSFDRIVHGAAFWQSPSAVKATGLTAATMLALQEGS